MKPPLSPLQVCFFCGQFKGDASLAPPRLTAYVGCRRHKTQARMETHNYRVEAFERWWTQTILDKPLYVGPMGKERARDAFLAGFPPGPGGKSMRRPWTRWETYCDGRRPDKACLVQEVVRLLRDARADSVRGRLNVNDNQLTRDLSKLRLETLAVLEDALPGQTGED